MIIIDPEEREDEFVGYDYPEDLPEDYFDISSKSSESEEENSDIHEPDHDVGYGSQSQNLN